MNTWIEIGKDGKREEKEKGEGKGGTSLTHPFVKTDYDSEFQRAVKPYFLFLNGAGEMALHDVSQHEDTSVDLQHLCEGQV